MTSCQGGVFSSLDANETLIVDSGQNGNDAFYRTDEPLAVGAYSVGANYAINHNMSIAAIEILASGGAVAAPPQRSLMGVGQ